MLIFLIFKKINLFFFKLIYRKVIQLQRIYQVSRLLYNSQCSVFRNLINHACISCTRKVIYMQRSSSPSLQRSSSHRWRRRKEKIRMTNRGD